MPKSYKRINKICEHCEEPFIAKVKSSRFCKDRECKLSRARDYFREYYQRPEEKKKKLERNKRYTPSEKSKQAKRKYVRRADVVERRRSRERERYKNLTPDQKAKKLEYQRNYSKRPAVVAKREAKLAKTRLVAKNLNVMTSVPPVKVLTPERYEHLRANGK